ncbi:MULTISPECIES: type II toxin-antitoxin system HipA family toxin [Streptomyces]|uniref:type II toxin-antitoxin system HipA family toxin n=1 Tax=Streptomyces TaxID=1883 RepID=UPI001414FBE4|nr:MULTISPECIES: HipA domain-containing protein [Streptomyces]MCC2265795.1 type II toxin-antitoxin system HipA family toxin [Streptomyces sp. CT1-17]
MTGRLPEVFHAVLLHGVRVGTLCQRGDHTRFVLHQSYVENPSRPVLGLRFEEDLTGSYAAALRLPRWFSNLLPEGPLREWIAQDRGVSLDREMELLAQVGHDLPGAVQVLAADGPDDGWEWSEASIALKAGGSARAAGGESPWRFSLAGVALKFSLLARGDRLTVPVGGELGDWLVKFPDYRHAHVPRNEFAMMSLAKQVGMDVPDVRLVHRDELEGIPDRMWPNQEEWAYAVRRFDRSPQPGRARIHIEDFAQVKDVYPIDKYNSSFETVVSYAYRGHDGEALREAVRRIAFSVVVGNGDAHLKNWSLIYRDQITPSLSPVYDLVSTIPYTPSDEVEDLGLKLSGSKRFEVVNAASFTRLERRLDHRFGTTGAKLGEIAVQTAEHVLEEWPAHEHLLSEVPDIRRSVTTWIQESAARLRKGSPTS